MQYKIQFPNRGAFISPVRRLTGPLFSCSFLLHRSPYNKKPVKYGLSKEHETGFEPEAEALFYIGFKVSCDISCDTLKYAILNRNFCDEHMP